MEGGKRNKGGERERQYFLELLKVIIIVFVCVCGRSAPADPLTPFRR